MRVGQAHKKLWDYFVIPMTENSGFCVQQGTYVEGIKEEVVLSPAHALSLIAAGEGTSTLLQTCICWR
jgi:hypothetical protein